MNMIFYGFIIYSPYRQGLEQVGFPPDFLQLISLVHLL